jgi:acetoin utilization protein AcuB
VNGPRGTQVAAKISVPFFVKLGDIMTRTVVSVAPDDRLRDAREKLEKHGFHHLLVVDRGALVGVLSDRDILRATSPFVGQLCERPQDGQTLDRRIHQLMTRAPVTGSVSDDVNDAAARLLNAGVSCLPVVGARDEPLGIVTWRDLLRHMLRRRHDVR